METIAVYWEPVIRVYGFDISPDLSFIEMDYPPEQAEYWGDRLESLCGDQDMFIMIVVQYIDLKTLRLCIAVRREMVDTCRQFLETPVAAGYGISFKVRQPVDLLFFHGPHFQDRYGIAEAAFRTLELQGIPQHAAGCTGTSVYLVLDGGKGPPAKEILAESFTVPTL